MVIISAMFGPQFVYNGDTQETAADINGTTRYAMATSGGSATPVARGSPALAAVQLKLDRKYSDIVGVQVGGGQSQPSKSSQSHPINPCPDRLYRLNAWKAFS